MAMLYAIDARLKRIIEVEVPRYRSHEPRCKNVSLHTT